MSGRPTVKLAFTAEGDWARHASAMLHSALSATPDADFHCYLMYARDAEPAGIAQLESVAANAGASLTRLPIPLTMLEGFPTRQFHRAAWYRVLLPELLPDAGRVLYLDADVIVTDDLLPLWQTALAGAPFAAVTNPLYPFMPDWPGRRLGVREPRRYINTGVLLMDLEALRREGFIDAVRRYAGRNPDNSCPEQDALSALYWQRLHLLHPRWNVQNTMFELPPRQLPLDPDDLRAARERPAVVHFIGPFKPWHYLCAHPLQHLYYQHLAATPWPPLPPEGRTTFNRLLYPLPLRLRHYALRVRRWLRQRSRPANRAAAGDV